MDDRKASVCARSRVKGCFEPPGSPFHGVRLDPDATDAAAVRGNPTRDPNATADHLRCEHGPLRQDNDASDLDSRRSGAR
jgi:hypothetical protein